MKNLELFVGLSELTPVEKLEVSGGGLQDIVIGWIVEKILDNPDVIYESAQATKRTFEKHPEIFVK